MARYLVTNLFLERPVVLSCVRTDGGVFVQGAFTLHAVPLSLLLEAVRELALVVWKGAWTDFLTHCSGKVQFH